MLFRSGDGVGIIWRKGLPLEDMEFFQFHPTGLAGLGILLMRRTGLRIGELRNLTLDCLEEDLYGNHFMKVPLGKLNNERVIPLDPETVESLDPERDLILQTRTWLSWLTGDLELAEQDLVAYRGDGGELHVLDAHCPHFGAHIGHGGRVVGDCVTCPYHGWEWGADGVNVQQ